MIKFLVSFTTRFIPRHYLQIFAALALKTLGVFYLGNKFEDPISGKKYRKLLPYGRTKVRENALAPHSMSLERHRLIWLYLRDKTSFFTEPQKVLHIAPEYCFLKIFKKQRNLDYVTADLISPWADVKMDVQAIPFPDSQFDVVICNHVLEHVDSDFKAMQEIFRVLKPGGFAILQVPMDLSMDKTLENPAYNTPELREKHYQQRDHLRLYGKDYGARLRSAGFVVDENDYVKTLPVNLVERYALPKDEILYVCSKS
ncbi:MAG TPA: methyltransferase domain-containing protein [Tenuifilaceae bacterium]|nr:methyltransferase domain-containing protein [Tenuifilaceae bacterium]HOZ16068.1 methyltransferase domain-containing protein [Tenuifilaceae bacterium]HPI44603.1 methyltransferase domain-containing protein [Tenuifilaceae bacterium]HPN22057.1 methyltransferase domain-containing protein [Tenuifilaceae bacterium]